MTRDEIIEKLNSTIDDGVSKINKSIPATQRRMLEELENLVRDLDYDGNNIKVSAKNVRVIGAIKNKLRRLILDDGYQENVKEYLKTFNEVSTLQNSYLRQTTSEFKIQPVLGEIKTQAIDSALESLTEQGLTANVIDKLQGVLRRNITTGGTFNQLMQQVRETVINTKSGEGILERYVKQVTTDSLNQYSRNYLQIATDSLGMDWFQYTGSNITTTRCFCIAMTKKRWFHRAEIPGLIKGDFEEFKNGDCEIYSRTGLPDGMVAGTNAANFLTYLGGYNCGHRALPVPARLVPEEAKEVFYNAYPSYRRNNK